MAARMVIRRLERRPLKALLSSLGIALSLAILLSTSALRGSIHRLMDVGFRQEQRQDVSLSFIEPQAEGALLEVQHLPGVLYVEPFRQVATRLRAGRHHENVSLLGLPPTGSLRLLLGADSQQVGLPPGGLLLSRELARRLGVTEGHELQVEVLEGKRPTRTVRIVGLIDDMLGLNAYISLEALHPLLGEGRRISGALATVDRMQEGEFLRTSAQIPKIAGVQVRATVLREFEETFAATQNVTTALLGFFASVITVGVVYNMARISLAESSREFASLRVLGFTRREIARIFFAELAMIVTGSLLPGVALGYGLAHFIAGRLPTEVYRLPIQIPGADLLRSVAIVAAAALATAIFVRRRLDRLDLIGVLKTRE
jgi:putative ABC transport system permease protein